MRVKIKEGLLLDIQATKTSLMILDDSGNTLLKVYSSDQPNYMDGVYGYCVEPKPDRFYDGLTACLYELSEKKEDFVELYLIQLPGFLPDYKFSEYIVEVILRRISDGNQRT